VILWKSGTVSPRRASFRYRVALPALYLERIGVRSRFQWSGRRVDWRGVDALVLSKTFEGADLALARVAWARGTPIILDLCDNIFVETYPVRARIVFEQIARLASVIVTTTPALADAIVRELPFRVAILTIPDPVEALEDTQAICERFRLAELAERWGLQAARIRHTARRRVHTIFTEPARVSRIALNRALHTIGISRQREAPTPSSPSVERPGRQTATGDGARIITWFGNHGGGDTEFGMLDILLAAPAIGAIARRRRIRLRVISNDATKFRQNIAPLPFPTEYLEWDPLKCHQWVRESDVVIIPTRLNDFTRCKSSNRALLALQNRVPVVATRTPAMAELDECVTLDDWEKGIETYLADRRLRETHLSRAAEAIRDRFAPSRVAQLWLTAVERAKGQAAPTARKADPRPVVVFLVQLIQDLELILPLYRRALAVRGWNPEVWLTTLDLFERPEMRKRLEAAGVRYEVVEPHRAAHGGFPHRASVVALISASESSLQPHGEAHLTTQWAKRHGVPTFTLQHGFENVGLTYSDDEFPIERVKFASDVIFLWGPAESLHPRVRKQTRRKCISVGCPKPLDGTASSLPRPVTSPMVVVFENLHWQRYPPEFRQAFLDDLDAVARAMRDVGFLIRPHPAGKWITERFKGSLRFPPNVTIADPRAEEWIAVSAVDILRHSVAAITTPSTTAVDAARLDQPVAVAAYGLDLSAYVPLPQLRSRDDWGAFLGAALGPRRPELVELSRRFARRSTLEGDAIERIFGIVAERVSLLPRVASG
jgi:hypothetical protein